MWDPSQKIRIFILTLQLSADAILSCPHWKACNIHQLTSYLLDRRTEYSKSPRWPLQDKGPLCCSFDLLFVQRPLFSWYQLSQSFEYHYALMCPLWAQGDESLSPLSIRQVELIWIFLSSDVASPFWFLQVRCLTFFYVHESFLALNRQIEKQDRISQFRVKTLYLKIRYQIHHRTHISNLLTEQLQEFYF